MANETGHRAGEEEKRTTKSQEHEPIIVDLGRKTKRDIDRLRKGRGPLLDDVDDCLAELRERGEISLLAQPVVVLVAERRRAGSFVPVMLPPGLPFILPTAGSREDDDDDDEDDEDDDEDNGDEDDDE